MLNAGIIGFGKMGMLHGALLEGSEKVTISAICDKAAIMRMGFKHIHPGVHTYKDADKMLEKEKPDIAIITTPTFNHAESIFKAGRFGCSIFVEKPLSTNSESAEKVCEFVEENNLKLQIGFCNRFVPTFSKAKLLLQDGKLGKLKNVQAWMYIGDVFEPHVGWRYNKKFSGGGALMDFGIHMIDLLIWLLGDIESVNAEAKKLYSLEVEDELNADVMFACGIKGHFETSWSKEEYRKSYSKIRIEGDNGALEATDQTLKIFDSRGNQTQDYTYPDLYGGAYMDIGGILYSKQMEAFLSLVQTGNTKGCTVREAVYVQKVIDAMYKSADKHEPVRMEDQ